MARVRKPAASSAASTSAKPPSRNDTVDRASHVEATAHKLHELADKVHKKAERIHGDAIASRERAQATRKQIDARRRSRLKNRKAI